MIKRYLKWTALGLIAFFALVFAGVWINNDIQNREFSRRYDAERIKERDDARLAARTEYFYTRYYTLKFLKTNSKCAGYYCDSQNISYDFKLCNKAPVPLNTIRILADGKFNGRSGSYYLSTIRVHDFTELKSDLIVPPGKCKDIRFSDFGFKKADVVVPRWVMPDFEFDPDMYSEFNNYITKSKQEDATQENDYWYGLRYTELDKNDLLLKYVPPQS